MKAVVWHNVGNVSVDDVPDPRVTDPADAIVRITTNAIFGVGPVGQPAVLSARMQGAGQVLIVDGNADRLERARLQNAETVDFNTED